MAKAISSNSSEAPPFLFAVSLSDHQTEAYDPRWPDLWDRWEEALKLTPRGRATDFWNRYEEDIALAKGLGCTAFRFSLAWSRIEPHPGEFNEEALAHYERVIAAIRAAGMEPLITLHHWTWPLHVEDRGGMPCDQFPEWFRAYAAVVAERFGRQARDWITFNEPNALPFGYFKFWWQPHYPVPPGLADATGRQQAESVAAVIRNLFLGHAAAREELRRVNPGALAAANPCILGLPDWLQRWLDKRAVGTSDPERWLHRVEQAASADPVHEPSGPLRALARVASRPIRQFVHKLDCFSTLADSAWWHLGIAGKLPQFLCPAACVGQQDYVPIDYYWGIDTLRAGKLFRLLGAMQQQFANAPVWPGGLYKVLRRCARLFPGQELFVMENGCTGAMDRARYLRAHWRQVQRARCAGYLVTGYTWWGLTTNREWGLPYEPSSDFGLYTIDLDSDPELTRRPTPAAKAFAEIAAGYRGTL
jgi:beta-glucosidase/6-phospho-beta-glucosidase/beta-galactosidase